MEPKIPTSTEFKKIAARLENHFDQRVELYGAGLQAVDWKSKQAQYNRFRQLVKVVDFSRSFSLNDYGCGDGELVNFLLESAGEFQYLGFDVSSKMIARAAENFAQLDNCRFSSRAADLQTADYTVASGIFNLKFEASDEEWKNYMIETIGELSRLSAKGFAFNALTSYSDQEFQRADLYYADPLFWFDYCKRNVSRYVALLHDYPEYDFTIIVRQ